MTIADVNFVSFDKDYIDTKQQIGFTLRKVKGFNAASLINSPFRFILWRL